VKNKLTFTSISESNIDSFAGKISELHSASSGKRHSPAYWYWRYLKGPAGSGNLIIALNGGDVVGKYGLRYLPLIIRGRRIKAGFMEGLLVSPLERFWQCYRGLVERCNREKQNNNLAFYLGMTHFRTLELHKRLGVIDLGRVPVYWGFLDIPRILEGRSVPRPLSLLGYLGQAIIGLRVGVKKISYLNIRQVKNFDSSFDELWENISKKYAISVIRNAQYLNWRYIENPTEKYECLAAYSDGRLEGLVVFRIADCHNEGYVFELFAREDSKSVMRELLLQAVKELKAKRIGYITVSFPATSNAAHVLRSMGFKSWGTRLWSIHMIVSSGSRTSLLPDLELRNWYFSLGDWLAS